MPATDSFRPDEAFARELDAGDSFRSFRDRFAVPRKPDGSAKVYLCGHSLGLQPLSARRIVDKELRAWADRGVEGHFTGDAPWYSYHEHLTESGARLVGARPNEVVFMNSLTVNLHLMLATFFQPQGDRVCILMDEPAFPSDLYALQSQLRHHGLDPAASLILGGDDFERVLRDRGREIAVVVWNAVNFLTGRYFDIPRLVEAAHRQGCFVGLDLAHAAGNVPLQLHDWGVDFAVWCGYKYLNGGPGAVGGCFVHERHGSNRSLPRLAGWWGNDPATRFRMQMEREFIPKPGADGWQVSNPPILSMAPLRASLELFDEAGIGPLRHKSERLTAYLLDLLDAIRDGQFEVVTPRRADSRGSQISLRIRERPRELAAALGKAGVIVDFREPDIIRAAAVPLYNSFGDVWMFVDVLRRFATDKEESG